MLFSLDSVGLSGDEGFTAQMVQLPWATMLSDLRSIDYNMRLHYLLLKGWGSVFGFSETAIRIPSVLAVLGALLSSYRLPARLLEPRAARLSVVFIALNPFVLMVGITARPYAFLLFWTVLASAALVSAVDDQHRSHWIRLSHSLLSPPLVFIG